MCHCVNMSSVCKYVIYRHCGNNSGRRHHRQASTTETFLVMAAQAGPSSASGKVGELSQLTAGALSGLWLGEAKPDPALANEVATNPIRWALALVPGGAEPISAFGGGYFDDAADVDGHPV